METQTSTLILGILVTSGIACQWISAMTRMPSILLLLLLGIFLGPITGIVNTRLTFGELLGPITSLSVAVILFEGGMSLRLKEMKKYGLVIYTLVTIGAAACIFATFLLMHFVLGFSVGFSLLQSAVLVITGPTVITPMLNQLHVIPRIRSILKWEGIVIDPVGAITAVIIFEALLGVPGHDVLPGILFAVFNSLTFGILLGVAGALIITYSIHKLWVPESMHSAVTLMMLFTVYLISDVIHMDSGLITVTVMGFVLGNQQKIEIHHIINFKENLTVILISFLFISLASTIELGLLIEMLDEALITLGFLILVARPLTVLFSGAFWKLPFKDALFMCCIAPRGIVTAAMASLFALELARTGFQEALFLTPITFGVIIGTVVFYSLFTPIAARFLGVSSGAENRILIIGANPLARAIGECLLKEGFDVQLIDSNYWKVSATQRFNLPVFRGTFLEYENKFPDKIEETDLVLALTESNDINSLAIIHLKRYVTDAKLFQLPVRADIAEENIMGQRVFSESHDFTFLSQLIQKGYVIKSTKLSPSFPFSQWKEMQGDQGVLLFQIKKNGALLPQVSEKTLHPTESGKIIYASLEP